MCVCVWQAVACALSKNPSDGFADASMCTHDVASWMGLEMRASGCLQFALHTDKLFGTRCHVTQCMFSMHAHFSAKLSLQKFGFSDHTWTKNIHSNPKPLVGGCRVVVILTGYVNFDPWPCMDGRNGREFLFPSGTAQYFSFSIVENTGELAHSKQVSQWVETDGGDAPEPRRNTRINGLVCQ